MTESAEKYLLTGKESERLLFRKLYESDFETWMAFCRDEESIRYMGIPKEMTNPVERCRYWFDRSFNRYNTGLGGLNVLVDKQTNAFVGQCGLMIQTVDDTEELEIGYSLLPPFRGKGYIIEAAIKCRDFAFENNFRDSLISIIHVDNLPSQKVALNNGMIKERTTVYKDMPVNIYRITKNDWLNLK